MSELHEAPRRPDTSRWFVLVGLALAVLSPLYIIVFGKLSGPLALFVVVGVFAAHGGSSAAALMLAALGAQRVRKRGGEIGAWIAGRHVALAMLLAGGGMLLSGAATLIAAATRANGTVGEGAVVGLAGGAVLTGAAVLMFRRSTAASLRLRVWALVITVAFVWIPREMGLFTVKLWSETDTISRNTTRNRRCNGGPRSQRRPNYRWRLVDNGLSGDVGSIVRERLRRGTLQRSDRGALDVRVAGRVDLAGPACYLPLYRFVSGHGALRVSLSYRDGAARCSASASTRLSINAYAVGLGSCHDLLRVLAGRVIREAHRAVRAALLH